jgi:succinate dehydrogenase/fumarate reductase flavoprotein subunit
VDRARCYLDRAPDILDRLTRLGAADFYLATQSLDYDSEATGATMGRRSLCPQPFDGRNLGDWFHRLQWPLRGSMLFGGMTVASADYGDYLNVGRSIGATARVAGWTFAYGYDRLRGAPRGLRLANGNALVARLLAAALRYGATILVEAATTDLVLEQGRVAGALLSGPDGTLWVRVSRGVVLASGGLTGDPKIAADFLPNLSRAQTHLRLVAGGVAGDGWRLATRHGAATVTDLAEPCAWAPASRVPGPPGTATAFPHFIERAKPGVIAVDRDGRRFANEANSYHRFVRALVDASAGATDATAFIIADHRAIRAYGLGAVPPAPARLSPWLRNGYLLKAPTLAGLAERIGVPAAQLCATVERFNSGAAKGEDPDFHRGISCHNRHYGDSKHLPNASLGALDKPPYYAVQVYPSDIGGFVGLRTDRHARVIGADGQAIAGLYAAGNDAASLFGGAYPAGGSTIGPAMVFGGIAALDLVAASNGSPQPAATPVNQPERMKLP